MASLSVVIRTLLKTYKPRPWWERVPPLELLVAVILSQRTNWRNARRALERLKERFGAVDRLAEASVEEIEDAIRPAGLYRSRASVLREVACAFGGSRIEDLLSLPYEEAKRRLMSVRGIGPKTADVFLMLARGEPVLPVDTHIRRVLVRLGFASGREGYEELRASLESEVPPEDRLRAHLALVAFGREVCRPVSPRCDICPFSAWCPSSIKPKRKTR